MNSFLPHVKVLSVTTCHLFPSDCYPSPPAPPNPPTPPAPPNPPSPPAPPNTPTPPDHLAFKCLHAASSKVRPATDFFIY